MNDIQRVAYWYRFDSILRRACIILNVAVHLVLNTIDSSELYVVIVWRTASLAVQMVGRYIDL